MVVAALTASVVVVALAAPAARAAGSGSSVPPPAGQIAVDLISIAGSGCPAGTVAVEVTGDNAGIHLLYGYYLAQVGLGARPTDFRKNCQLTLRVSVPPGLTVGVVSVDQGGYVGLAEGATATVRESVRQAGDPLPTWVSHTFTGPMDEDWHVSDAWPYEQTHSPCGSPITLNLHNELRVSAGTSDPKTTTSYIVMDGLDINPSRYGSTLRLAWANC